MSFLQSILLGLVQGITEILPISSDGHLAILQYIWNIPESVRVNLTAALHLGTALAILFAFWPRLKEIITGVFAVEPVKRRENINLVIFIFVASLPVVFAGLFVKDLVEQFFTQKSFIAIFFLLNGTLLYLTRYAKEKKDSFNWVTAILVGLIQTTALLPAVSRSGTTISLAVLLGVERKKAFDFSFLLAVPVTIGAALFELLQLNFSLLAPAAVFLGIFLAGASGVLMIFLLRRWVTSQRFFLFGVYCWLMGLLVLFLLR